MTTYPELVLIHAPSLGSLTKVFVYRNDSHARVVVSGAMGQSENPRRELDEAERDELALLIGVLDPYKLPEKDPCRRSMKDGSSWIMLTGLPDRRVDRTRQVTSNPECREVEDAARRLMGLAGVICGGRSCLLRAQVDAGSDRRL